MKRLIRILVYEGTSDWIDEVMKQRGVKGSHSVAEGIIKEAILGDFFESVRISPNEHLIRSLETLRKGAEAQDLLGFADDVKRLMDSLR